MKRPCSPAGMTDTLQKQRPPHDPARVSFPVRKSAAASRRGEPERAPASSWQPSARTQIEFMHPTNVSPRVEWGGDNTAAYPRVSGVGEERGPIVLRALELYGGA
ncbi:hypothetical protein SKAU_G00229130 [Synaphobranchus kaupii]|uniref:Uncharacterized protein n=1 Tax=Synaphobranchus kaupii TaxID=118154 RepID=A0A9Q1F583_SYNKA|nr:hypothetical protein SKAU_G00229130 [Synaphobranchus kaupii]